MTKYLAVIAGGGIGSGLRYWLQGYIYERAGSAFPYGTIAVNIIGCLAIGALMTSLEDRFLASPTLRLFLTVGVLGGFTTFSTFSYETIALFRDGEFLSGAINALSSVILCLGATWAGMQLGKLL